jgi:predicted GH43/DUF377 family glycosyl hydrolase
MNLLPVIIILLILCPSYSKAQDVKAREVLPAKKGDATVPPEVMNDIYEKVKTPFKYGIVIKGEKGTKVDSPSVFRHGDKWYMMYIIFDGRGYETAIAESVDLLHWKKLGKILNFTDGTWDAYQAAGYIALQDHAWQGSYELQQHEGKYWLSYLGGNVKGYEAGRLGIGIASTTEPGAAKPWARLDENPVLTPDQLDARKFENETLFKSHIIRDQSKSLGYPFVMFYNARGEAGHESIGMAVSEDIVNWQRYGDGAVIDHGSGISGDPQITKIGDVWVMFYFGAFWKPKAFETFACSCDLVNWTKWEGPHLIEPSEPWDSKYAHKPWVVVHNDVVYHFYNAVGSEGRVIALATSKDVRTDDKKSKE